MNNTTTSKAKLKKIEKRNKDMKDERNDMLPEFKMKLAETILGSSIF